MKMVVNDSYSRLAPSPYCILSAWELNIMGISETSADSDFLIQDGQ